ncbi:hypothetical protein DOTSEDRAFT_181917 [Dothistroma septosporum NZE10]|uniref:NmrA-like domain-containing protein n=1 Tax=Dothistroma septosporum (strain NZE10 / CBS 128990) TaxID=675120 RepID=M2YHX0_DOTSN|nr:hypothetical protein DOTSEDRAFT_181917 [Dothistroma septosporum NZE10]
MTVDTGNDLVLITAASGKQASALLPHLYGKWERLRLRLQCISDSSAARLREQYPNAEVVQSGFADLFSARKLLDGVSVCFLITPGFHPREAQHGMNMVDAALESYHSTGDFKHMVFSSVLHPIKTAMANHDNKRTVEEALAESDLPYTVVQPTQLMDNVPIKMIAAQEKPVFPARFKPATKFTLVSCYDLGEAVANIITQREKHFFATYQISATPPMDFYEGMSLVSEVIGKNVKVQRIPLEDAVKGFESTIPQGTDERDKEAIKRNAARMLVYYESQGLIGNANVLEMLLGREPLGWRGWVEMMVK